MKVIINPSQNEEAIKRWKKSIFAGKLLRSLLLYLFEFLAEVDVILHSHFEV
jgi:hypothetical protein